MMLQVTGIYAALLTVLFLFLSVRVIAFRRENRVDIGDGNSDALLRRIRAQANFAEYAPLGIVLLGIAELQGHSAWILHIMGVLLLGGRVIHGVNFTYALKRMPLRAGGMALTLVSLGLGAVLALPL